MKKQNQAKYENLRLDSNIINISAKVSRESKRKRIDSSETLLVLRKREKRIRENQKGIE